MKRVSPAPRSHGHAALGLAGVFAAVFVLGGCPGEIDPSIMPSTGGGGSGGTCDPAPIFTAKGCATAGVCHGGAAPAAGFDMAMAAWETHLVGVVSAGGGSTLPSQCGAAAGAYLITGQQPAAGLFMQKLLPGPPCGGQMPQNGLGGFLTQTEINCVQKWANALVTAGPTGGGGTSDGGTD